MTPPFEPKIAMVREVPDSYPDCIVTFKDSERIEVRKARDQHEAYCVALRDAGLRIERIPADEKHPDCPFIEDPAFVAEGRALISILGTASRQGEEGPVARALARHMPIERMREPARMEGGDLLRIAKTVYVGQSVRTNGAAVDQLRTTFHPLGINVQPVPIHDILHLKSCCTALSDGTLIVVPGHFDAHLIKVKESIVLPKAERAAANCMAFGNRVLIPKDNPNARQALVERGLDVIELDISEFQKGEGSLTCLSLLI